jgi:predicted nucleotidyltransferase component of viral defense system
MHSQYYEESLYPLQNGVLNALNNYGTRFFLTGGTALGRAYYNHRYSDDLDFFVNADLEYNEQVAIVLTRLPDDGFVIDKSGFIKDVGFTSFNVRWEHTDAVLKLDFVNDVLPHFGEIKKTPLFDRTDSIRNILSNKLTAIFRFAAKDVVDIREIALHEKIVWSEIIVEAREKALGVEIPVIAEILQGMPQKEFEGINWVKKPAWEVFRADIDAIVLAMMDDT